MNKTVLITGASSGIGYELAKIFAKEKYNLVIVARNKIVLEQVKNELEKKHNINIKSIVKDLSEPNSSQEIIEEINKDKIEINILINNAGFGTFGEFTNLSFEKQKSLLEVNVRTLIELSYYFIKEMKKRKEGKILNVASIAAYEPGPYMAMYYASKAFVLSFTESMHKELKPYGISVSALCPGPTETNFEKEAKMDKSKMFKVLLVSKKEKVAYKGYKALMKNKVITIPGLSNKIVVFSSRILPKSVIRNVSSYINIGKVK